MKKIKNSFLLLTYQLYLHHTNQLSMQKLEEVIFYSLEKSIKVYRKFAQKQLAANGFDVTIDQWLVLKSLHENQDLSQSDIAELVFKDTASVTRIIELLVQKSYLQRHINSVDRRKFHLTITKNGIGLIDQIATVIKDNRKKALKGFRPTEIENLKQQLEKIIANCNTEN